MTTAIVLLLIAVVGLLAVIAIMVYRSNRFGVGAAVTESIDCAVERLDGSIRHHTEVNAVLALTEAAGRNPELLNNLESYSHDVVTASLLLRVNTLGNDYQAAQLALTRMRRSQMESTRTDNGTMSYYEGQIERLEHICFDLERQLMEANGVVVGFTRPQLVR